MRAANLFVLDDDIIDRVLRLSWDFTVLRSFVLSCRAVHDVYRAHPKSINRAVGYNIVGPVLPQALQLIRNQRSTTPGSKESFHVPPVDSSTVISRPEMDALKNNEDIVSQLEDMFSLRYIASQLILRAISASAMPDTRIVRRIPAFSPTLNLSAFVVPSIIYGYSNPFSHGVRKPLTSWMAPTKLPKSSLTRCARTDWNTCRSIPHQNSMR
jgi:hypothetical protein